MYDEKAIVVGKDIATGTYTKSFIDTELDASPKVDSTTHDDDDVEFEEVTKGKEASSTTIPSSQKRSHRKRKHDFEDDGVEKLAIEVKEVALAIKDLNKSQLVISELYDFIGRKSVAIVVTENDIA
ncbi:hypothetical protein JCGZ_15562 [Jatropha curcas]|uniref:Uncharacterized protein n=1 Tax=Jatropha curcas TaxID=180498 RepID=A0A067K779_JATCU|nr:hypothetical protein JCGZ_15562 [Jatropha curcas]